MHCRRRYREAEAPAEHSLLCLRVELGMEGYAGWFHVSVGVGEAVCGVGSHRFMGIVRVLSGISLEGR